MHVIAWLKWMRLTPTKRKLKFIPPVITPSKFQSAFKVQDEMTSSSPSGLHYTLWKAIAEKEEMCAYMSIIISLPFMYGFTKKEMGKCN